MCPQPNFDHEDEEITSGNSEAMINGGKVDPGVTSWSRDRVPAKLNGSPYCM